MIPGAPATLALVPPTDHDDVTLDIAHVARHVDDPTERAEALAALGLVEVETPKWRRV